MNRLQIGFGISLGLLLGVSLWNCSFSLSERTICTGDMGCKGQPDAGPTQPPDLAPDPNDPSIPGTFGVATLTVTSPPSSLADQLLLGPSDDGTGISQRQLTYPLVLIAPPASTNLAAMRQYADRLCSHGFIVGLYQISDQSNHTAYRDNALGYLNFLLNNTDASIKSRIDTTKLGLVGYQLSGKISVAMAAQDSRIGGLFLIDPVDVFATSGAIDGITTMAQVTLAGGGTVAMLGEGRSTTATPMCVQSPQKGYGDFYTAARSPAFAIDFGGANLGDFIEGFPDPVCTMGSTAPRSQTQGLAMKYMTAYFQWTLKGHARSREYLLGNDFSVDANQAMLTEKSK